MANAVYVCLRDPSEAQFDQLQAGLEHFANYFAPDNLEPCSPKFSRDKQTLGCVFSPVDSVKIRREGICLGTIKSDSAWITVGSGAPDGSFVVFRHDKNAVEIVTDVVASRPTWYYYDTSIFLAATSQRALVALLGSFEFNSAAIPWILTTGSLGPTAAWDRRIFRLGADSTLRLSLRDWAVHIESTDVQFRPSRAPLEELQRGLKTCLETNIGSMDFDYSKWILPLSGGYDSRALLYLLPNPSNIRTVTWGIESIKQEVGTDGLIAGQLAKEVGTKHRFIPIDDSGEPIEVVFDRFIKCGEGTIDHFAGYTDGFNLWRKFSEDGINGIIRGDTTFTAKDVDSPTDVLQVLGIYHWNDFANLPTANECGITDIELPEEFQRRGGETLPQWRDRLMRTVRIPTVIASLNSLKSHYVEVANPFLYREIADFHATIPDPLRTEKRLLRTLFEPGNPAHLSESNIPFAQYSALARKARILGSADAVKVLRSTAKSDLAYALLPHALLDTLSKNIKHYEASNRTLRRRALNLVGYSLRQNVKRILPRSEPAPKLSFNALAFRVLVICKMHEVLTQDSTTVKSVLQ